ncbi:MAG TPA: HAMP domain-containing sensor histidine kinase [Lachnospiraceae bacterium]|nr:HAMP domain-containing sensor histidine kinase [Lachnospiraceae bacterium]
MQSFGKYILKHLVSFSLFIILLMFINVLAFALTFYSAVSNDFGEASPTSMLRQTVNSSSSNGISDAMAAKLRQENIWAMFLNEEGKLLWSVALPEGIPTSYTIQDFAMFTRGYLNMYPVFVWNTEDGLLVLGYPRGSYTKIVRKDYPINVIKILPLFITLILAINLLLLFVAYYFSKRKIMRNTEPIVESITALSQGKPVVLSIHGELTEVADGLNKASQILSRQNEARANWISGVSHDIRTPLSMIMGYADRISSDHTLNPSVNEQAKIIRQQSMKIKELIKDLNLVSQLEYDMQPLKKSSVRMSKLLRTLTAELLNTGIPEQHSIELVIEPSAEQLVFECDERLLSRAITNLIQNSIKHNPQGCSIRLLLNCKAESFITIAVADDVVGIAPERLQELSDKPHYMESMDERLDLRHGLGLLLVQQITRAHNGTMRIDSPVDGGCRTILAFPYLECL